MGLEASGLSTNENDSRGSAVAMMSNRDDLAVHNNHNPREVIRAQTTVAAAGVVEPSQAGGDLVYVLGTLGYDFGTEARRDSFKQLMGPIVVDGIGQVPANPYDARQMVAYLREPAAKPKALIWTVNLELQPSTPSGQKAASPNRSTEPWLICSAVRFWPRLTPRTSNV